MEIVPVLHSYIHKISSLRIYHPNDLRPKTARLSVLKTINEVKKRFSDKIPLLNPIKDMNIKDDSFKAIVGMIEKFEGQLYSHPMFENKNMAPFYEQYLSKIELLDQLKCTKEEFRKAKSVLQMEELKHRKRVLRRLGYCTASDIIEFKGRVACELSAADELLLTEMIFNGVFNTLSVEQCVALLSCFVCDEKSSESNSVAEELSGPLQQMHDLAKRIAKVMSY